MTQLSISPDLENKLIEKFDLLLQSLHTFKQALDFETDTIKTKSPVELTQSSEQKQSAVKALEVATLNIAVDIKPIRIDKILMAPENLSNQQLAKLVKECAELTVICNNQNISNGMSIQILSNANSEMLHLLKGDNNSVKLYGAKGGKEQQPIGKTTLGKA